MRPIGKACLHRILVKLCYIYIYIYLSAFIAKKHRNLPRKGIQHTPLSYLETNTCHIFFKIFCNKQNYVGSFRSFPSQNTRTIPSFPMARETTPSPGLRSFSFWKRYCASVASCTWARLRVPLWPRQRANIVPLLGWKDRFNRGGQPNKSNQKNDIEVGITMV